MDAGVVFGHTDPRRLTMGLDLNNDGQVNQKMQGPLGVDIDNDGTVDVVITPDQLRAMILAGGTPLNAAGARAMTGQQPGFGSFHVPAPRAPYPPPTMPMASAPVAVHMPMPTMPMPTAQPQFGTFSMLPSQPHMAQPPLQAQPQFSTQLNMMPSEPLAQTGTPRHVHTSLGPHTQLNGQPVQSYAAPPAQPQFATQMRLPSQPQMVPPPLQAQPPLQPQLAQPQFIPQMNMMPPSEPLAYDTSQGKLSHNHFHTTHGKQTIKGRAVQPDQGLTYAAPPPPVIHHQIQPVVQVAPPVQQPVRTVEKIVEKIVYVDRYVDRPSDVEHVEKGQQAPVENDFPYHNPLPEYGCNFVSHELEPTNEPMFRGFW